MRLVEIPKQAAESVLSLAGIRTGTEEPHYLATRLTDQVEIRRYGPRIPPIRRRNEIAIPVRPSRAK